MKRKAIILIIILLITAGVVAADSAPGGPHILNPDFGSHLGTVADSNAENQSGIFVYDSNGQLVINMFSEDVEAAAFEYTGRYLVAYDESGQALYDMPDGRFQMQLTTSNGSINLNYASHGSDMKAGEAQTETEDILLQQSDDGLYSLYLLGNGELSVVMGPDNAGLSYQVTFTGVPALNIKLDTLTPGLG
jgi:hypothetical protein